MHIVSVRTAALTAAVLAGAAVLTAPLAQAASPTKYLCNALQTTSTHGLGPRDCVSTADSAPTRGLITGSFEIAARTGGHTLQCAENGTRHSGQVSLPTQVMGLSCTQSP